MLRCVFWLEWKHLSCKKNMSSTCTCFEHLGIVSSDIGIVLITALTSEHAARVCLSKCVAWRSEVASGMHEMYAIEGHKRLTPTGGFGKFGGGCCHTTMGKAASSGNTGSASCTRLNSSLTVPRQHALGQT